jgi:hypothetical protein
MELALSDDTTVLRAPAAGYNMVAQNQTVSISK